MAKFIMYTQHGWNHHDLHWGPKSNDGDQNCWSQLPYVGPSQYLDGRPSKSGYNIQVFNHPVDSVVYPMQVQMMAAYRWIQSPSRLAWSEGWRPFGAQCTFIKMNPVNSHINVAMMTAYKHWHQYLLLVLLLLFFQYIIIIIITLTAISS